MPAVLTGGCDADSAAANGGQGYLSFWNDNISYALRGCILIELALRRRIALVRDPSRRALPPSERVVEVIDTRLTGETILDETLKMMKQTETAGEKMAINTWIDLLSGESYIHHTATRQVSEVQPVLKRYAISQARHGT